MAQPIVRLLPDGIEDGGKSGRSGADKSLERVLQPPAEVC